MKLFLKIALTVTALSVAACSSPGSSCTSSSDCSSAQTCVNGVCMSNTGTGGGSNTGGGMATGGGSGGGGGGGGKMDAGEQLAAPNPPTGADFCDDSVVVGAGPSNITDSTTGAEDDLHPSCIDADGPDRVYRVQVPPNQRMIATVTPVNPPDDAGTDFFDPAIYVLEGPAAECVVDAGIVCLATRDSKNAGEPETLRYMNESSSPRTVFLVVDSYSSTVVFGSTRNHGEFTLTLSFETPGTGETCSSATALSVDTPITNETNDGAGADYANGVQFPGCESGTNGEDRAYTFEVPGGKRATVVATTTVDGGTKPSVNLIKGPPANCGAQPRVCVAGATSPAEATWMNGSSDPARIYAVVDSFVDSIVSYDIVLHIEDPTPGDGCGINATALTPGTPLTGLDSAGFHDDFGYSSLCETDDTTDRVFSVEVPAGQQVEITVTPGAGLDTSIGIATSTEKCESVQCSAANDEFGKGEVDRALWTNDTGSTVTINVMVELRGTGTFDIGAVLRPPPEGDVCGVTPVALTPGTPLTGQTLASYTDDYGYDSECYTTSTEDRVYTVEVPAGKLLALTATPEPDLDLTLSITTDLATCKSLTCVGGSDNGYDGAVESATWSNRTTQTVTAYIIVEAFGTGSYALSALVQDPPPGDVCSSATALSPGTLTGQTTVGFGNDYVTTTTDSMGCSGSTGGGDRVYSISVPSGNRALVTVNGSSSSIDPSVNFVEGPASACEMKPRVCVSGAAASYGSYTVTGSYTNAGSQSKDVFVLVDSASAGGTFDLTYSVAPPPPSDTCATVDAASTLTLGTPKTGQNLTGFVNDNYDSPSSCSGYGGGDRVYAVDVPAGQVLSVTGTPTVAADAGVDLVLNMYKSPATNCGSTACVARADRSFSSGPETMTWYNASTSQERVFVVVAAYSASAQVTDFSLSATATTPAAGETCSTAVAISAAGVTNDTFVGSTKELSMGTGCVTFTVDDRVFAITIPASKRLEATVTPASMDDDIIINMVKGPVTSCGAPIACTANVDDQYEGDPETLSYTNSTTSAQPVYLIVSRASGSPTMGSTFTLDVQFK